MKSVRIPIHIKDGYLVLHISIFFLYEEKAMKASGKQIFVLAFSF